MVIFRGRRNAVIVTFVGDREVVASIAAGDPSGLAEAYDRYAPGLHAYCRSMLREPADAADAVQDTFVIAASRLGGLREPDRLRPWLYAVARNICLRKLRADKSGSRSAPALGTPVPLARSADKPRAGGEAPDPGTPGADVPAPGNVSDDAEFAELRALVRDAAGGLTTRDREVLRLRLWEELGPDEAGAVLGVSRGYANALFTRAREQLTACLGDLLVARTGRADCTALGVMLADWDGRLTILLRKRLSRHIERCDTCTGRRRRDLVPALLGLSPGAAIAAAAAIRDAAAQGPGAPLALKARALAAAAGHGNTGAAGRFGARGFPRPAHRVSHWIPRTARAGRAPATVAGSTATVAAAVAVTLALTLPGGGGPGRPPGAAPGGGPGRTAPGHRASGNSTHSGGKHTPGRSNTGASTGHEDHSGNNTATPVGPGSALALGSRKVVPAPTSQYPSQPGTGPSSAPPPTPAPAPGGPGSPSSTPPASPTTGSISVTPTTVLLTPLLGGTLTITAVGGPVNWSLSERSSLIGSLTVSPSSGHLAAGASTTVAISAPNLASLDTTLTATPGGAVVHVLLGVGL